MAFGKGKILSGGSKNKRPRFQRRGIRGPTLRSMDKRIKKLNANEELKHDDTIFTANVLTTAGTFTLLNTVLKGDDDDTRDGNEIQATSIQARFSHVSGIAGAGGSLFRMILFWDQQANGVAPTIVQLLDTTIMTVALYAPYNRDNQKRFKILKDRTFFVDPGNTQVSQSIQMFKKKLSRKVKYNDGVAGTIADINTNSLYILMLSTAVANGPTINGGARFYYKD